MIFSEKSTTNDLQETINKFNCPVCPSAPECPDCNCAGKGAACPACICEGKGDTDCPKCPKCPKVSGPSVDDIVNAIFPGRHAGMTSHGKYFSYGDFTEKKLKSTFQAMDDLTVSTMGSGIPSRVNFEKQTLTNDKSDIGLASKVEPPIGSGAGVFSKPSSVVPKPKVKVKKKTPTPAPATTPAPTTTTPTTTTPTTTT